MSSSVMATTQRTYSGAVRGEIVIQGDLHAHGDINIVTNRARSVFRSISESPNVFGAVQDEIEGIMSALISVSTITDEYTSEGRLDAPKRADLVRIASACQGSLGRLESLKVDFEKWGMQDVRQEELSEMMNVLDEQTRDLRKINANIVKTSVNLETLLQKYIAEVLGGKRDSSIRSASTLSSISSTDQRAWTQVRRELQAVGITPQQFDQERELIIATLQEAFGPSPSSPTAQPAKKASQINRLVSNMTGKSQLLLSAAHTGNFGNVKRALQNNAYVDARDDDDRTALMIAARNGYIELIGLLLLHHADVNKMNKFDYTALHETVENNHVATAKLLLEHGADVDFKSEHGKNPLLLAVLNERLELVKLFLEHKAITGIRSDYCDPDPISHPVQFPGTIQPTPGKGRGSGVPLHAAVLVGSVDIVRCLLEFGADTEERLTVQDGKSYTSIHLAIQDTRLVVLQPLLEYGARIDATDSAGCTALLIAVETNQRDAVKFLLENGASVKMADSVYESTPRQGTDMVDPPIHYKVDPTFGEVLSPLHVAAYMGDTYLAETLIEHGAEVNKLAPMRVVTSARSQNIPLGGESPLWLAAGDGHYDMVKLLLVYNATVENIGSPYRCLSHQPSECLFVRNAVTECSAIQLAVAHGHEHTAKALLDAGANLEAWLPGNSLGSGGSIHAGSRKTKLLHMAVGSRSHFLQMILYLGHNIDAQDSFGRTALHFAVDTATRTGDARDEEARIHDIRVIESLIARGANVSATTEWGHAALHYAVTKPGRVDAAGSATRFKITQILLANGADPNARSSRSRSTPLHYAALGRDIEMLKVLVVKGGDLSAEDTEGRDVRDKYCTEGKPGKRRMT